MKGTITLTHDGNLISSLSFNSPINIQRIKDNWRKLYGKGYDKAKVTETITQPNKKEVQPSPFKKGFKPKSYSFNKLNTKSAASRL